MHVAKMTILPRGWCHHRVRIPFLKLKLAESRGDDDGQRLGTMMMRKRLATMQINADPDRLRASRVESRADLVWRRGLHLELPLPAVAGIVLIAALVCIFVAVGKLCGR